MTTDLELNWGCIESALNGTGALNAAKELERFHYFAIRGTPEQKCIAAHIASVLIALEQVGRPLTEGN